MKITDSLIVALLKNGVIGSIKNFRTEVAIPNDGEDGANKAPIKCVITASDLEIKLLKE